MAETFAAWKDKFLYWMVTTVILGVVSWSTWMTIRVMELPTQDEIKQLIKTETPYSAERQMILAKLESIQATRSELMAIVERNTTAINQLKIELARLPGANR